MGSDSASQAEEMYQISISIHAPRMGSDTDGIDKCQSIVISIHAPRMGSDLTEANQQLETVQFQSTLPAWGATYQISETELTQLISIHAPRMGSDCIRYRRPS